MRHFISILYVAALSTYSRSCVCIICTCRCIIMPVLHPAGVASCQSEWARLLWVPLQKHSVGGCTINILSRLCVLEWTCLLCVLSVRICSPLSRGHPTSAVCVTSEAFSRWLHYQYTSTTACAICKCWCIVMSVYDACVASCQSEWACLLCVPLQKHYVGGYTINMFPRLCVLERTCLLCMLSVNRVGYCIRMVLHQVGTVSCCFSSRLCVCVPLQKHSIGGSAVNILPQLCV